MSFSDKTEFKAGSLGFSQNTINADFDTKFNWLKGFNLAFGAEARFENFKIAQGEEASWASYDINGNLVTPKTDASLNQQISMARQTWRCTGISGFRPENALNKGRRSVAAYVDTELDITDKWLLSAALRFENYSDFGSTFNYKIATRYKITDNINFRAAHSTGFRLHLCNRSILILLLLSSLVVFLMR